MKSHEIGQLTIDNWQRITYRCQRATDKVKSDIKHGRKYDEVQCIEWTSPEGVLFWLYMDYRHQVPVLIPCIVGGTTERPQFFFPQNYIDTGGAQIDLYTCHFMERYRDRQTKLNLPMKEVVKRYAINNISNLCIWRNEDDSKRVFAVRQGLNFAKADRLYNRWIYTTYVSNDMLGETQREAKDVIKEILDRQDTLFNGTKQYHQLEWEMLDVYITERMKQLRPLAEDIYNSYYEDAEE
jgi:hypothetical protein